MSRDVVSHEDSFPFSNNKQPELYHDGKWGGVNYSRVCDDETGPTAMQNGLSFSTIKEDTTNQAVYIIPLPKNQRRLEFGQHHLKAHTEEEVSTLRWW